MAEQTSVFIHALSAPPGLSASAKDRFLHRDAPGWGVRQAIHCLADAVLLLIVDHLCIDSPWTRGPGQPPDLFRDSEAVLGSLVEAGRASVHDSGQILQQSGELISSLVSAGLKDPQPWLQAQQSSAEEWADQEVLAQRLWEITHPQGPAWRQALDQVNLSAPRHAYRNQTQAVLALLTLLGWQSVSDMDPGMFREAIGRELLYVYASAVVAARLQAIPHDWSDFLPLMARLTPPGSAPVLSVRLPSLKSHPEDEMVALLCSQELAPSRELTARALAGEGVSVGDIERELLRVVPREARAPYAYRQVSFYRYAPDFASRIGLPTRGLFAISKWRVTGPTGM